MTGNDDTIHTLAGPYALDALDDLERRRFEQHLDAGCATCEDEVAGFLDVTAALGAAERAPVSDRLRLAAREIPETVQQVGPVPESRGRRRRNGWRLATVAAAVLAVVGIGLGAVVIDQQRRIDRLTEDATVAAILERPDATVASSDTPSGTTVRVVRSPSSGDGAVLVSGLDRLPSDRTYQVWWIDEGGASSAGLLDVDTDGSGTSVVEPRPASTALAISVEPAGGSAQPTTTPIVVVELP